LPFDGPVRVAVAEVLNKLGIDPRYRLGEHDQDPEYTSCRSEEIPRYLDLYVHGDLEPDERAVLCCFLLQGLNELIQAGTPHPLQADIFNALFDAEDIHRAELAYWMDTSDPERENWWPITDALLLHRASRR
jgi:hypothetical protein